MPKELLLYGRVHVDLVRCASARCRRASASPAPVPSRQQKKANRR
ncbi:hypothetical protein ACN20G_25250 [Streptomyces sp. BI20]